MDDMVYDRINGEYIPVPDEMKQFLDEIAQVCRRHGFSIAHEDHHGAFLVERYSEENIGWLCVAGKNYG